MSSILADQQRPRIGGQMRGGRLRGSQPRSAAVHRSPNKLWSSNSIFNLWISPRLGQVVQSVRAGGMDRPSRTKLHHAGFLSSSQQGGPPCWASPLAFGLIDQYLLKDRTAHAHPKKTAQKGRLVNTEQLQSCRSKEAMATDQPDTTLMVQTSMDYRSAALHINKKQSTLKYKVQDQKFFLLRLSL